MNSQYLRYKSNQGDLIVLSLFPDKASLVTSEISRLDIKYPCVPGVGSVSNLFSIYTTPWIILIAPDKRVVEKDIYPVATLDSILKLYNLASPIATKHEKVENAFSCVFDKNNLILNVKKEGIYSVSLFSINGKLSSKFFSVNLSAGTHAFPVQNKYPKEGCYIVEITNGKNVYRQLAVAR